MTSYLTAMKRYAAFSGRSSRKEFWLFTLSVVLEMVIAMAIGAMAGDESLGTALAGLVALIHLIPLLSVQVRRLHDINRSGWWILIQLIPVGQLVTLVMYCLPSTPGTNRFGANPYGTTEKPAAPAQDQTVQARGESAIGRIEKLSRLKEAGAISEDEFNKMKAEALGQGSAAQ